jgi:putative protease
MTFTDNPGGFSLEMEDGSGARITVARLFAKELAEKEQTDNIRVQLAKLGNTLFEAEKIEVNLTDNWFVPSSLLADMRREAVNLLLSDRRIRYPRELSRKPDSVAKPLFPQQQLTYLGNVANTRACSFYQEHGVKTIDPAFELKAPDHVPLMFSKHCLRYSMGWCPTYQKKKSPFREPYYLLYKEVRLRLMFDCKHCQMLVLKEVNE